MKGCCTGRRFALCEGANQRFVVPLSRAPLDGIFRSEGVPPSNEDLELR